MDKTLIIAPLSSKIHTKSKHERMKACRSGENQAARSSERLLTAGSSILQQHIIAICKMLQRRPWGRRSFPFRCAPRRFAMRRCPAPLISGEFHWRRIIHPHCHEWQRAPWQHAHTQAPERRRCGMPPCARAPPLSGTCSLQSRMPKHASGCSKCPATSICGSLTFQSSSQPHVEHRHEPLL